MRRATKLGEPPGSEDFLADLEAKAGRRLRMYAQGRPSAKTKAAAVEVSGRYSGTEMSSVPFLVAGGQKGTDDIS
jgi:hypothetical protein